MTFQVPIKSWIFIIFRWITTCWFLWLKSHLIDTCSLFKLIILAIIWRTLISIHHFSIDLYGFSVNAFKINDNQRQLPQNNLTETKQAFQEIIQCVLAGQFEVAVLKIRLIWFLIRFTLQIIALRSKNSCQHVKKSDEYLHWDENSYKF